MLKKLKFEALLFSSLSGTDNKEFTNTLDAAGAF